MNNEKILDAEKSVICNLLINKEAIQYNKNRVTTQNGIQMPFWISTQKSFFYLPRPKTEVLEMTQVEDLTRRYG